MNKQNPRKYIEFLIEAGKIVLGSTRDDITRFFRNNEMCLIEYLNGGKEQSKSIEIQFETANLTCTFDGSELCEMSILYIEKLDDIAHYIRYCDKAFTYDSDADIWDSGHSDLIIKQSDARIAFVQRVL